MNLLQNITWEEGDILTSTQIRIILNYLFLNYWVLIIYHSDPIPDTTAQITLAITHIEFSIKDCLIHFNDSFRAQGINIPVSKHCTDSLINKPTTLHNSSSTTR